MRLILVLFLLAASGASAQPLTIERVEAPASVTSGDGVRIMLTVRVRNRSDSNKRYALTAVVDGSERDRRTSTSALAPGRAESVPLAWTQAVSGSAVRGHVALLNTRGMELARASFDIPVARGGPEPPIVTAPIPPVGSRPVPGIPRPELPPGTAPETGGVDFRPVEVDGTPIPLRTKDLAVRPTVYFREIGNSVAALPRNRNVSLLDLRFPLIYFGEGVLDETVEITVSVFKPDGEDRWRRTRQVTRTVEYSRDPLSPRSPRFARVAMGTEGPSILPYESAFIIWVDVALPGDTRSDNDRIEIRGQIRDARGFGGTRFEADVESTTQGPKIDTRSLVIRR